MAFQILLEENRSVTADAIVRDRLTLEWPLTVILIGAFCSIIEALYPREYVVIFLKSSQKKGWKIVHDPRVIWNTMDVVVT